MLLALLFQRGEDVIVAVCSAYRTMIFSRRSRQFVRWVDERPVEARVDGEAIRDFDRVDADAWK